VVVFPNCKINLGLHITAKRPDGYHDLETVFYPLPLYDALEWIKEASTQAIRFTGSGREITGDPAHNLCVKAWHLLKKDYPQLTGGQMHLHKNIPIGAGLGGGSADGAFALQLLNRAFNLGLTAAQLAAYALQLGSDCPFFILNQPAFARGRGELLEPLGLSLAGYRLVVINPGIHIPTGWAFSQVQPGPAVTPLQELLGKPIEHWKDRLVNVFEPPVMKAYPELAAIKTALYRAGALYAAMSGSGSTFFGIFSKKSDITIEIPEHYLVLRLDMD
jgi:4-diphosphocytidyl-2-C-methyl-D-erythritol kinase